VLTGSLGLYGYRRLSRLLSYRFIRLPCDRGLSRTEVGDKNRTLRLGAARAGTRCE
jgi:hypothetical protein